MIKAYKRVVSNKGSSGIDEMSVEDLADYLNEHWLSIKSQLLAGDYYPSGIRQVEIPKPSGGVRKLEELVKSEQLNLALTKEVHGGMLVQAI